MSTVILFTFLKIFNISKVNNTKILFEKDSQSLLTFVQFILSIR